MEDGDLAVLRERSSYVYLASPVLSAMTTIEQVEQQIEVAIGVFFY